MYDYDWHGLNALWNEWDMDMTWSVEQTVPINTREIAPIRAHILVHTHVIHNHVQFYFICNR